MSEAWTNFAVLIFVQLIIFATFAFYEKKTSSAWRILWKGILIGIPFGLSFDLILGKFLGFSTYALGFDFSFLIPNAAFSYGIFAATILLLRERRSINFCIAVLFITALYEFANFFLNVWQWHFPVPIILYLLVLAVGYLVGAILVVKADQVLSFKKSQ